MKKTILNPLVVREILERADQLQPQSQALWGKMNVTEMLSHCNLAHQSILKAPKASVKATFKQKLAKLYFFYYKKEFPRYAKGPEKFDMRGKVDALLFEEEKSKFFHIVKKFSNLESQMEAVHPRLGPLNHKYWGKFVWMHLDHHLRQFGV
ncbi:DUF1569 domain-containing protein [Shivajiella indica]|uniref:DUF1569 domain-containing protein n=1 Tax=Shivajiella indica TaxID=872115 RepID=A0ABW5B4S9_9BACT